MGKMFGLVFGMVVGVSFVSAGEGKTGGYDLEQVQGIQGFVGSAAAKEQLAREGFVVTDQQFKQIFEAYIQSPLPKFITTDSAWDTYHFLLENGVKHLEEIQAGVLQEFSRRLMGAALAKGGQADGAYTQLAQFAAVGLGLQDAGAVAGLDAAVKAPVTKVLARLQAQSGLVSIPFVELRIDTGRLKANSFYTQSPELQGYFAARQWYAMCDFQLRSKKATGLALRMALLIESDPELKRWYETLTRPYDALLAPTEDGDVRQYMAIARKVYGPTISEAAIEGKLEEFCRVAGETLADPKINDQYLEPDEYASFPKFIKGFRLLPTRQLPCAVLYQNTTDPHIPGRMYPSGIDVFAVGPLACEAGKRALATDGEKNLQAILKTKATELPESLHGQAMKLLGMLQEPLPDTAPAALRTPAWQDKQLWTQLGAWAQQRHTWALHTKLTVTASCVVHEFDEGMVSPYPHFFTGLGQLARATGVELARCSGNDGTDTKAFGRELLDQISRFKKHEKGNGPGVYDSRLEGFIEFLSEYEKNYPQDIKEEAFPDQPTDEDFEKLILRPIEPLEAMARRLAEGGKPTAKDLEILKLYRVATDDIPTLLGEFAGLCDHLAEMAAKELSQTPLDDADRQCLRDYGQALGKFHFYSSNSWLNPKDDFGQVAPVFQNPRKGQTLYVGTARPEALYVVAERNGRLMLYRGAVLSYREFLRPMSQPLDDETWRKQIGQGSSPPPPAFTRSFRQGLSEEEIVRKIQGGENLPDINLVSGKKITHALIEKLKADRPVLPFDPDRRMQNLMANRELLETLCQRVGPEDVGELIELLPYLGPNGERLVRRIQRLPWQPYRDRLMSFLDGDQYQLGNYAAQILVSRPEMIDVKVLLAHYDQKPEFIKRSYCELFKLGIVPVEDRMNLIKKILSDPNVGLRYQGLNLIVSYDLRTPQVRQELVRLLDDENDYLAASAARMLRLWNFKDTAPILLARLKKGFTWYSAREDEYRRMKFVRLANVPMGGPRALVLAGDGILGRPDIGPLSRELIIGLGYFHYEPAKEEIRKMLTTKLEPEAAVAMEKFEPGRHVDRLMPIVLRHNSEVSRVTLSEAVFLIGKDGRTEQAKQLLPLLDEEWMVDVSKGEQMWRMCDAAAQATASLLKWPENITIESREEDKAKLIGKIKVWAEQKRP